MIATQAGVELQSFERHDVSGTYQSRYDVETTSAAVTVVTTVAEATGIEPIQLDSLQKPIGTDALDRLLRSKETTEGAVDVPFVFEGRTVTVTRDGTVTVSPPRMSPDPDRLRVKTPGAVDLSRRNKKILPLSPTTGSRRYRYITVQFGDGNETIIPFLLLFPTNKAFVAVQSIVLSYIFVD